MLPAGGPSATGRSGVGRGRALLLGALVLVVLVGGGALLVGAIASGFEAGAPSEAVVGHLDDFPPGSATLLRPRREAGEADLYITRPPGGAVVALARHGSVYVPLGAGCAVAWFPERSVEGERGVFRDGCHPIYYAIDGRRLSPDAARDLDRYGVEVRSDGTVVVDLGDLRRRDATAARASPRPCRSPRSPLRRADRRGGAATRPNRRAAGRAPSRSLCGRLCRRRGCPRARGRR